MLDVKSVYNSYVNGILTPEETARMLYEEINGITRITYTPKKFTIRNHLCAVSIPKAKKKEYSKYTIELIKTLKEKYPDIILEAHLGKQASSKHHKEGLAFILANA